MEGCGKEFTLEGEDFVCGDEIELDNTESGCGYLLCSDCQKKQNIRKPISMPLPKCSKCKKTLEPEFTTEKEDGDDSKPEILMMFGRCEDCKIITMCNLIKTEDIPTPEDLDVLVGNSVGGIEQ